MPAFDFSEKKLPDIPVVVLDTETTGLFPGLGHRVVEIGAVRYENGRPVAEFQQLLDPGRPMDPKASEVSGITDDQLLGQPPFARILPGLDRFLDGALIVAHNADFDASFLGLEYWLATPEAAFGRLLLENPWLCTLQLARRHFHFGSNSLAQVARQLQVRIGRAHRALNDVYMTADVLFRLARELARSTGLHTVGDLLHGQGGAIYAPPPVKVILPPLLEQALAAGQEADILYVSRDEGETRRRISPRYATYHNGAAYLVAHCHLRGEQRTFRVDRILGVTLE